MILPTPTSTLFSCSFFFFFNDTATTEIYTLSLHDALPISFQPSPYMLQEEEKTKRSTPAAFAAWASRTDRKSTRLNSSHLVISYAVFCLKKKKNKKAKTKNAIHHQLDKQ